MSEIKAEFYFNHLKRIIDSEKDQKEKILEIFSALKEFFFDFVNRENQFFLNFYATTIFLGDRYIKDKKLIDHIHRFRYFSKQLTNNKKLLASNEDLLFAQSVYLRSVEILTNTQIPEALTTDFNSEFRFTRESDYKKKLRKSTKLISGNLIKGKLVQEDITYSIFKLDTEMYNDITVRVYGKFNEIAGLFWKGCKINLIDFIYIDSKYPYFKNTQNSYVVIDPDYLVDVTDVAECFSYNGFNENLYFLKKFIIGRSTQSMIIGNLVNSIFDELLRDENQDFDSILQKAAKSNPLQVLTLMNRDPEMFGNVRRRLAEHYTTLKSVIKNFESELLSIEPSFISSEYGIQGRLDAMIEYEDEIERKDIVELKSGKAPSYKMFWTNSNQTYQTGVWSNNLAQISLYNVLLDAAYANRKGTSMVLYSQADLHPIRNVPNIVYSKQDAIILRNKIVAIDNALIKMKYDLFDKINLDDFGDRPTFVNNEISSFANIYSNLSDVEREYFYTYINFIQKEIHAQKTGLGTYSYGFSALWNSYNLSTDNSYSIINDIKFDPDKSNLEKQHLVFEKPYDTITTLRKGDLVLLIPDYSGGFVLSSIVLKGYIRSSDDNNIEISLRNKLIDQSIIHKTKVWKIAADHSDILNKKQFKSIVEFMSSDVNFRDLILGKREPEFQEIEKVMLRELNSNQNELINKALSAKDYYLIQGPPGTGKTSYVLRCIIEQLLETTNENLLVLAYTNRAVDEICSALKKNCSNNILRLGSKVSTIHDDIHIAELFENSSSTELYDLISNRRIIISTVASAMTNPEIFELKQFNTAIVDEASQILESQIIGTLSKVERFILIGDEKQLPAVISHEKNILNDQIFDPYQSLFERLLKLCKDNGRENVIGLLNHQARMHSDLMKFPNYMFYDKKLKTFDSMKWQYDKDSFFSNESESWLERELSKSRIIFINTNSENSLKVNRHEIKIVVECLDLIQRSKSNMNSNTVGVISPFRAQCSEILKSLDQSTRKLITVDTVERFQGSERDTIILSLAVNCEHDLSLITVSNTSNIDRKFNVAITRASQRLIVIGNANLLSLSPTYSAFIDFVKANGNFIKAGNE